MEHEIKDEIKTETLEGFLFDAYVEGGRIVVWIWSQGSVRKFTDSFSPALYVIPDKRLIAFLMARHVVMRFTVKKDFAEQKDVQVLELRPGIGRFFEIVRAIEDYGSYTYELSNADIPLEQRYFFEKGLFPLCKVRIVAEDARKSHPDGEGIGRQGDTGQGTGRQRGSGQGGHGSGQEIQRITSIQNIDEDAADYEIPSFRVLTLKVACADDLRKGSHVPVAMIALNGRAIEGEEDGILRQFTALYTALDPDVLLAEHGDLALPHLAARLARHGIAFQFGRDPDLFSRCGGRSYYSYGRILYKDRPAVLKGRLHVDTNAFIPKESGFAGCVELARLCRVPLQRMARQSPGSGISNLQVLYAYPDYLIPHRKSQAERYKTGMDLFLADKGGVILEPTTGFHENIAELDFVSMYPSIIVRHNISPETVGCSCCDANTPGINLAVCTRRQGLIPRILAPLIARRSRYKARPSERNKQRATALKWVLVTCFGYLGFRHAKFGRIEAHEAINAHARTTLLAAVRTAEEHGFAVVHGIIDSLWVKKPGMARHDVDRLAEAISSATDLPIAVEGMYRWAVFLPSVAHPGVSVPSRFYGTFEDGTLKCRGIDLRRRDTPAIVADFQREALAELAACRTRQEFFAGVERCIAILKRATQRLSLLTPKDARMLTLKKRISKLDYANETAQKIITGRLEDGGLILHPGESITYVIRDRNARRPRDRFSLPHETDRIDTDAYRDLLICAGENLFLSFGYTRARILRMVRHESQLSLFDCFLEWKPLPLGEVFRVGRVQQTIRVFS